MVQNGQTRRALLRAVAGGAVVGVALTGPAGCGWLGGGKLGTVDTTVPSPLAPTLTGTLALIAVYTTTIAAQPTLAGRLDPLLREHRAHVDALRQAMGTPTSGSPSAAATASPSVPANPTDALARVRAAEQAARDTVVTDCLTGQARYAALLGSIAASRSCHLEVLA